MSLQITEQDSTMTVTDRVLATDYSSHPAELVGSGKIQNKERVVDVKQLRAAIPAHCFQPSYLISLYYLVRDLVMFFGLAYVAMTCIPLVDSAWLRGIIWIAYGILNGLIGTGIWVLGHECGHGAFSKSDALNHVVGFTLHSFLLTPYFAWRSTHRRHHIYANNLAKDHNYVPPQRAEYAASLFLNATGIDAARLEELSEDAPLITFLRIVLQQVIGFPWYLITNITASSTSLPKGRTPSKLPLGNSHFIPWSTLFRPEEYILMLVSDLGLLAMLAALYQASRALGWLPVLILYGQPYMWVNHWIVAITYLHHTHPRLPKYEDASWSFLRGALATVDRDMGWIGRHLFHNIVEYHVVHHLFSRIPFYRAREATDAIRPLLGDAYFAERHRWAVSALWESFTRCQWVEPEIDGPDMDMARCAMYYRGGPSPPPETSMNLRGFGVGARRQSGGRDR